MAKKPTKKKAVKKTAAAAGPEQASRENIRFFMGQMILAGMAGKTIPTAKAGKSEAEVQNAEAQNLRQYAERLANQLRRFD